MKIMIGHTHTSGALANRTDDLLYLEKQNLKVGNILAMQTPEKKDSYPVVLEVECDHRRPERTSRVHAGSCIRNLEDI